MEPQPSVNPKNPARTSPECDQLEEPQRREPQTNALQDGLGQPMKLQAELGRPSDMWSAGEGEPNSSSPSEMFTSSRKRAAKRSVPDEQKDVGYWVRRQRNNAAARRSRETKRVQEQQYKTHLTATQKTVEVLLDILFRVKERFICVDPNLLTELGFDRIAHVVPSIILQQNPRLQAISDQNATRDSASSEAMPSLPCDSSPDSPDFQEAPSTAAPPELLPAQDAPLAVSGALCSAAPSTSAAPNCGVSSQAPIDLVSPPASPSHRGRHPTPKERWASALKNSLREAAEASPSSSTEHASSAFVAAPQAPASNPTGELPTVTPLQAADLVQLIARADPSLAQQMLHLGLCFGADPAEKRARLAEPVEPQNPGVQAPRAILIPAMQPLKAADERRNGGAAFQDERALQQQQLQVQQQTLQEQELFHLTSEALALRGISPRHQLVHQQQQQEQQQQVNRTLRSTSPTFRKFADYSLLLPQCSQTTTPPQQDFSKFQVYVPPQPMVLDTPSFDSQQLQSELDSIVNRVKNLVLSFPDKADSVLKMIIPPFQEFILEFTPTNLKAVWFDEVFQDIAACLRRDTENLQLKLEPLLRAKLAHLRNQLLTKIQTIQGESASRQQLDNLYNGVSMTLSRLAAERLSPAASETSVKEPAPSSSVPEDEYLRKSDELAKNRTIMFQKLEMLRQDSNLPLERVNEELSKLNANNATYSRLVEESRKNMMHARATMAQSAVAVVENPCLLHYKRGSAHYHRKYNYPPHQVTEK